MKILSRAHVLFECNDNEQLHSSNETHYDTENSPSSALPKEEIMSLIGPLLENRVLESVSLLAKHFESDPRYSSLSFKEWFDIVKLLYVIK